MPAIPIHSSSPISAAKAQGITPRTSEAESHPAHAGSPMSKGQTVPPTSTQRYAPAQPGAAPALPAETGTSQIQTHAQGPPPAPTRTQDEPETGPPPPQPGAVPVAPGASSSSTLPPPPKAGEAYTPPQPTPNAMPIPPQMSIPPPTTSYSSQLGMGTSTSTTSTTASHMGQSTAATSTTTIAGPGAVPAAAGGYDAGSLSHPPGYQQNVGAADFSSHQRAAHNASETSSYGRFGDEDEGVWDTAKKWAAAAGENLVAAENEVWKRINK